MNHVHPISLEIETGFEVASWTAGFQPQHLQHSTYGGAAVSTAGKKKTSFHFLVVNYPFKLTTCGDV